ncbi:MAG: hypothetical protein IJU95_04995 [Treponema sp.]|nr:hypothetical protein [Treponema sp.]
MKKILIVASVVCAAFMFEACRTTTPGYEHSSFPNDSSSYQVMGRVVVRFKEGKAAYYKLVEEAQKKYPGTDDVVNIMVDVEDGKNYVMSGIAIKYVR